MCIRDSIKYKQLPRFPAATRDLAVLVGKETGAGDMMQAIFKAGGKRVEQVELFDVYEGEKIGAGKKLSLIHIYRQAHRKETGQDG